MSSLPRAAGVARERATGNYRQLSDRRDRGYDIRMTEDRRTRPTATPGEDPRERDEETTSPVALDKLAAQEGLVNPPDRVGGLGTSSDAAPGRDLPDLDDTDTVDRLRDDA